MQSVADWEGADEMHTAGSETNASVFAPAVSSGALAWLTFVT